MTTHISYKAFLTEFPDGEYAAAACGRTRRIATLENNWRRLRMGMSVHDADRLIGPLSGFGIDAINGSKDASDAGRTTQPFGARQVYNDAFCRLTFDERRDLWSKRGGSPRLV